LVYFCTVLFILIFVKVRYLFFGNFEKIFLLQVQPQHIRIFAVVQRVALRIDVAVNQGGGGFSKEIELLVVPESGYLFVITQQPVYRYAVSF